MDEQTLRRHLIGTLERIRSSGQARARDVDTSGNSLDLNEVSVASGELKGLAAECTDSLSQLGLDAAAGSLAQQADRLMNSVLDMAFCEMVASGDDAERLRQRFGNFPMPHPDPEVHRQIQNDRMLAISGLGTQLAEFVSGLISAIDTDTSPQWLFRLEGGVYRIKGFDEDVRMPKLKGFDQLHALVTHGEVPMRQLADGSGGKDSPVGDWTPQKSADKQTLSEIRDRRKELQAELDRSKDDCDYATKERCENELAKLTQYLNNATGVGGQIRNLDKETDRLRTKIRGTINTAIDKLREAGAPKLADHFELYAVAQVDAYVYQSPENRNWHH